MVARSARSSRPSLSDDGFAPIFPVVPLPASHQAPLEPARIAELAPERLELPPPEPEVQGSWLDDPSYQTAAFLAGL